jgi:hypothetical protein
MNGTNYQQTLDIPDNFIMCMENRHIMVVDEHRENVVQLLTELREQYRLVRFTSNLDYALEEANAGEGLCINAMIIGVNDNILSLGLAYVIKSDHPHMEVVVRDQQNNPRLAAVFGSSAIHYHTQQEGDRKIVEFLAEKLGKQNG